MRIWYSNVDGLLNKLDELKLRVSIESPDIVVLVESIPKAQRKPLSVANFSIGQEFQMYLNFDPTIVNLGSSGKRGVIVYVHASVKSSLVNIDMKTVEGIWIEVALQASEKLLIGAMYRSPSLDKRNSAEVLCSIFEEAASRTSRQLLILGDFNYGEINWETCSSNAHQDHYSHRFLNCINDLFLCQHIVSPTHFKPGCQPSLIDLVFSSDQHMLDCLEQKAPLGESHHQCISFKVVCYAEGRTRTKRRNFNRGNYSAMQQECETSEICKITEIEDVDCAWESLRTFLQLLTCTHVPFTVCKQKQKHPYCNGAVKKLKKEKDKQYGTYKLTRSSDDLEKFKKTKNKLRNMTRNLRQKFEAKLAANMKENPKGFWQYISSQVKVKDRVQDLQDDHGEWAKSSLEKANMLNKFFGSVFTHEQKLSPNKGRLQAPCKISILQITREAVRKKLEDLNCHKSPGPDEIHPRILKELAEYLSGPLSLIFNKSLESASLPVTWREAEVVPLFKKGQRKDPGNYRPISLTSITCKVMESLVKDHILEFLMTNDLISKYQYGFQPGKSCTTQLIRVIDYWTDALDQHDAIDAVYLDFQKAFDKVPHRRLIFKLKTLGIQGQILNWIEAFLTDRRQRVTVDGQSSNWIQVTSGVPQGTVLGPLLFLAYVNDLPDQLQSCSMMFADDTKVYRRVSDHSDQEALQSDLDKLELWSAKWQLPFNARKCKVLQLGQINPECHYKIAGAELERVSIELDLGIWIDHNLTYHEQTAKAVKRATRALGLVRVTFAKLTIKTLSMLFKAFVRPHLEYGSCVWGPMLCGDQDAVERVQRRATKLVIEIRHLSYEERLNKVHLPSMYYRRCRGDLILVYQIVTHKLNVIPGDFFKMDNSGRTRGHPLKIQQPHIRTQLRQNSFCIRVVPLWNSLPTDVVMAPNVNIFKNRLDKHWEGRQYKIRPSR